MTVAVATVADALARLRELYVLTGYGLRGGHFRSNGDSTRVVLTDAQLTEDLSVSGTVEGDDALGAGASVDITVERDDGRPLHLTWTNRGLGQPVVVTGPGIEAQARPV